MSAILGTAVTGAGGGVYTIDNSLRIRRSVSAYLNRTPASVGNRQKFTISMWVKRGDLENRTTLISAGTSSGGGGPGGSIYFNSSGGGYKLEFIGAGGSSYYIYTTQVFFDPSSWYHFVFAFDTTQATSSDRIKAYVNGSQITAFSTANYPSQNFNTDYNNTVIHAIGSRTDDGTPPVSTFDGYMAEIYMVDGQQLTPSSFGATDANTGVWQPKAYSGSYGTNGFYLKFSDIATTSGSNAGLGKDFSGNANYWNTNNISVTSGVTYDAMKDSPTPKSSTVGNYCVLNPISKTSSTTVLNANLGMTTSNNSQAVGGTFAVNTGKWYWEATVGTSVSGEAYFGIATTAFDETRYAGGAYVLYISDGNAYTTSVFGYGASYAQGDVLACALNCDTGTVTFYKNGVSQGNITGVSMTTPWKASLQLAGFSASTAWNFNFGQRPFTYTPPSGFVALNTFNLPTPTIGASSTTLANKYFNAVLYSGNNSTQNITVGFQPDFVWSKCRNVARSHRLSDAVRGSTRDLYSDTTGVEQNDGSITSFISTGFSLNNATGSQYNTSGENYVSWAWKANGSGSTNTAGSITSTVSANTTSGFSIVTYTGNGTNATVGHGLGVGPRMIIVKKRSASDPWPIYHITTGVQEYFFLNTTDSTYNNLPNYWGSTAPSATVFGLGPGYGGNNSNGATYVAYCFAEIAGYSSINSYKGNGSSNGPFIYTGFRPEFVIIKGSNYSGADWVMYDAARNTYNALTSELNPNSSASENNFGGAARMDFVSNGIKIRTSGAGLNASGYTYIYIAFAENPFKYANAR